MRIKIGGGPVEMFTAGKARDVQKKIQDQILGAITRETIEVNVPRIQRLGDAIRATATLEALQLFNVVGDIIDKREGGVSALTMRGRGPSAFKGSTITWPALNFRYALWKERRAARRMMTLKRRPNRAKQSEGLRRAGSFFILDGKLRAYLKRSGASIVLSRYGGVQVDVDTTGLPGRGRRLREFALNKGDGSLSSERDMKILLGRIRVSIFPRISPSLLPGLASQRWSETFQQATFEKATLPGTIANKLSGGRGPYRPLVLPVTQFFVMNRIPGVITAQINKTLGRTVRSSAIQ